MEAIFDPLDEEEILKENALKLQNNGQSLREIANNLNISFGKVRWLLRDVKRDVVKKSDEPLREDIYSRVERLEKLVQKLNMAENSLDPQEIKDYIDSQNQIILRKIKSIYSIIFRLATKLNIPTDELFSNDQELQ